MITFVSPHYNGGTHLEKMSFSLMQLKERLNYPIEWVIVDDCSTDNSYAVARNIKENIDWVRLIQLDKNSGPGIARIKGAEAAIYDYIFLIDVDDEILLDNCIDFIGFFTKEKNNFDFFYCPLLIKEIASTQQPLLPYPKKMHIVKKPTDFIRFGFPQPSSLILRKEFYLALDKGVNLPWGEDFYTYMSIAKAGLGLRWEMPVSIYIISPYGRGARISFKNRVLLSWELFKASFFKGKIFDSLLFTFYLTIRHMISYLYKRFLK
ncbi:glycosyltransferase family 2 protein [Mixta calida]|uniref:glycosyltransferase family 2 protein n=1 Tax=Mixta calida TaxID=665913 RepID=UPI0005361830|nr:glycosyltransferase family 2 protein [Mixta calida]AIX73223.1 hypothetical protein PSNIH2_05175 [Pantoea sp. PSNIH2]MDU5770424.1 glycosyltransferase family 2 protein [Mixta calida]POU48001.1 glycosyltransferase family 2 protein [Pantoea sp. PSNIH5]POU66308.1 glycosyltransferase family 2 protein [Pantoea sp. PSNIH4]